MERFPVNEYNYKYCFNDRRPLFEGILKYSDSSPVIFHMPGHRQQKVFGQGFDTELIKLDVTEIHCTDNLHNPTGIIADAQRLAAMTFGADESFFIVNGSTSGVHAMILTTCNQGDKILIARDCHKSAINAIILSGAVPVYIAAGFDDNCCVPVPPKLEDVKAALQQHPDAKAVFLTRPNYYGICCELKYIADIVHEAGMILMVDEAHGAHFLLSNELPEPALKCGADMCVQSIHKTLPALTQCAMLHVKSHRVDLEKLRFYLRMLQTSSPSYILMSSIDCCRDFIDNEGKKRMSWLLERICLLKEQITELSKIDILWQFLSSEFRRDYTRLVFNVSKTGFTGYEAMDILAAQYNLQPEMADLFNIVCISTVCNGNKDFDILANALKYLEHFSSIQSFYEQKVQSKRNGNQLLSTAIKRFWSENNGYQDIPLRETIKHEWTKIKLEHSQGCISCGIITPYPPGIPIVMPGEKINEEHIFILNLILAKGGFVEGVDKQGYITVIKNQ